MTTAPAERDVGAAPAAGAELAQVLPGQNVTSERHLLPGQYLASERHLLPGQKSRTFCLGST